MSPLGMLYGVPIVIGDASMDSAPRMTLSERVPVTPAFRAEMNAWMLEFFGKTEAIVLTSKFPPKMIMGPETFRQLEARLITHRYPT